MKLSEFVKHMPKPSVTIITGRRGSGKDVTAAALAEELHKYTGKTIYSNYNPRQYKLPDYWKMRGVSWREKSITLISDAELELFSREWQKQPHTAYIQVAAVSRHKDIDFIHTTQTSTLLDKETVIQLDVLLFKEPSTLADRFERTEIRDLTQEAVNIFKDKSQQEKWETAYAYTHTGAYTITDIKKPPYWTEEMSKMFGQQQSWWQRIA